MSSQGKIQRATKMKMKGVVEWLIIFFLICSNALLCSSAHELRPLKKENQLINNELKRQRTSFNGLREAVYVGKVKRLDVEDHNKKGKGSYGGGDLLRPRGHRNGANSLLLQSFSLLSTLLLLRYVLVGLLATMFFF